jgi:hypothetical protein
MPLDGSARITGGPRLHAGVGAITIGISRGTSSKGLPPLGKDGGVLALLIRCLFISLVVVWFFIQSIIK